MAKYIYAEEVPEISRPYITANKRYKVACEEPGVITGYNIEDDEGREIFVLREGCAFLEGGSWIETDTP